MRDLRFAARVRFTIEEWELLDRMAAAKRVTIEELIREELRLRPLETRRTRPRRRARHLRLVGSELTGRLAEDG